MSTRAWSGAPWAALRKQGTTLAAIAACGALMGCTATVVPSTQPPAPVTGSAIMDWTVAGSRDPSECVATGAVTFNVTLTDSAGATAGQWVQDCQAFATTVDGLVADSYTGSANLLDSGGSPRTTAVPLAPFQVLGGTHVSVPMDFPANSFF
jgi:hypothetical protein